MVFVLLPRGGRPEMGRVHATFRASIKVIYRHAFRDRPYKKLVGETMRVDQLASYPESPVASGGCTGCPQPAVPRLVYLFPKPFDGISHCYVSILGGAGGH